MAIQLTESAARHVKSMLTHREGAIGLRLGTRKSGCTGFAYVVDYAQQVGEDDTL
ncbi:MAG: iron-sulfur cluster assembly protein IscA, partial [gamma proteobacterium symbiont of Ctena orbiculata]